MSVNNTRLIDRFETISAIGKTKNGGVTRLALSERDKEARDVFVNWLKELNLDVRIDDFGNIYGIKYGTNQQLKPIVMGSHLDSVIKGGKYDGTLGVLVGLEVIESFIEQNIEHERSLIVVNFTNEEGARFPKPMLCSGGITGVFNKEEIYELKDDDGLRFIDELKKISYLGDEKNRLQEVEAFIELHIEQGPVLVENEAKVGVVKGIQGLAWYEVTFLGEADHAGPTPMKKRKDAFIGVAKSIYKLTQWVKSLNDETSITFGKASVEPNIINVIPGKATFSIDLRHPDKEILSERIATMKEVLVKVALEERLDSQIKELSHMNPVEFSESLVSKLETISKIENLEMKTMYSGAGHDAMYMNRIGPTVMIFVPSLNGKSHCEEEISSWEDIISCSNVMFKLVKEICKSSYHSLET